jgi:uncharacterized protein
MKEVRFGLFIWNSEKNKENIEKHGVDFRSAIEAFADPSRLIAVDESHSEKEERFFCIGNAEKKICTVRFVYRDGLVRIYGAGYWRKGRRFYEEKRQK